LKPNETSASFPDFFFDGPRRSKMRPKYLARHIDAPEQKNDRSHQERYPAPRPRQLAAEA